MGSGYKFDVDPSPISKLTEELLKASKAAKALNDDVDDLNSSVRQTGRSSGGVRGSGGSSGGSYGSARSYRPTGPFGRAEYERRRMEDLRASGFRADSDATMNQRYRVKMAERAESRARSTIDGKNPFEEVFNRTRFNLPGGINPLGRDLKAWTDPAFVGSVAKQLGLGAEAQAVVKSFAASALPAVVGVAGAAAAIGGLYAVSNAVQDRLHVGTAGALYGGGSPRAIGAALAYSGGDPTRAATLGERLRAGGMAAGWARSKGYYDLGSYTIDKNSNYVGIIDELSKLPRNKKIQYAREFGLTPEEFGRTYLSQAERDELKASYGEAGSDRGIGQEAQYQASKDKFSNSWDQTVRAVATPIMDDFRRNYLDPFNRLNPIGKPSEEWILDQLITVGSKASFGLADGWMGKKKDEWKRQQPWYHDEYVSENRSADSVREQRNELIGGGPRAAAAMRPGQAMNISMNQADAESMRLGAFAL